MFLRSIQIPINKIEGIGSSNVAKFARLGIHNINDLLTHYPRDWEDRGKLNPLKNYQNGKVCSTVKVIARDWIGFGRMKTLKVYVEDETAQAALLCFNRPWLEKQLTEGKQFKLWGKFYYKYGELQSGSFEIEDAEIKNSFGKILPVYSLTSGLTQAVLRKFISRALNYYSKEVEDELPRDLIEKYNLFLKSDALKAIHFPESFEELERAKKTLIYEELFYLEVMVGRRAKERKKNFNAKVAKDTKDEI